MDSKAVFSMCRVCFATSSFASLSSLFDAGGEKEKLFEIISGIDIGQDRGKHDAMICDRCLKMLDGLSWMRERSIKAEESHFGVNRKKFSEENAKLEEKAQEEKALFGGSVVTKKEDSFTVTDFLSVEMDPDESQNPSTSQSVKQEESYEEVINIESDEEEEEPVDQLQDFEEEILRVENGRAKSIKKPNKTKTCPHCNKTLKSSYTLKLHIQSIHEKIKRFSCPHCEDMFYYKQTLKNHMKRLHNIS